MSGHTQGYSADGAGDLHSLGEQAVKEFTNI